uniref:Uncharacterized protein n=1 Tax=Setaria italica TaxID=4555 RepID=K4AMZ4_SETIT
MFNKEAYGPISIPSSYFNNSLLEILYKKPNEEEATADVPCKQEMSPIVQKCQLSLA